MRCMTMVKTRESGARPSPALIEKIGKFELEVEVRQMMDAPPTEGR